MRKPLPPATKQYAPSLRGWTAASCSRGSSKSTASANTAVPDAPPAMVVRGSSPLPLNSAVPSSSRVVLAVVSAIVVGGRLVVGAAVAMRVVRSVYRGRVVVASGAFVSGTNSALTTHTPRRMPTLVVWPWPTRIAHVSPGPSMHSRTGAARVRGAMTSTSTRRKAMVSETRTKTS